MIALLARAGTGGEVPSARFSRLRHGEDELVVVSVERPQIRPPFQLAPSERDVTDLLVQGKSYEEIARVRGRSVRTIANQISSVFRRLGLSGRGELVARLVAEGSAPVRRPERVPA